ncbi:MAG: hypothetical protein IIW48_10060 [Clostridia bacterium]|nr:hypothetical protein [Clostridia bacterium]
MNINNVKKILEVTECIANSDPDLKKEHLKLKTAVEMIENNLSTKPLILRFAQEVREVTDIEEAARLTQSDNWIIVHAAKKENGIMWVLIRLGDEDRAAVQDE